MSIFYDDIKVISIKYCIKIAVNSSPKKDLLLSFLKKKEYVESYNLFKKIINSSAFYTENRGFHVRNNIAEIYYKGQVFNVSTIELFKFLCQLYSQNKLS